MCRGEVGIWECLKRRYSECSSIGESTAEVSLEVRSSVLRLHYIMGCYSSRLCLEESLLLSNSTQTGFEPHHIQHSISVIHCYSITKIVLKTQFAAIERTLNLNTNPTSQPILHAFYRRLSIQIADPKHKILSAQPHLSAEYVNTEFALSEKELLVAVVLLGSGSVTDKANALFHVFDESRVSLVDGEEIKEMLGLMFRLAIEDLPVLSSQRNDEEVKRYLDKARNCSEAAVKVAFAVLMENQNQLSLDTFSHRMEKFRDGELTSPEGLRTFARSCSANDT